MLGLTAIIGALVAILAFAMMRFAAAARDARRNLREGRMESALLSSALEEAIAKLKAQERAASTRAEASERLSEQIVASLASGLMVVGLDDRVQITILPRQGAPRGAEPDRRDNLELNLWAGSQPCPLPSELRPLVRSQKARAESPRAFAVSASDQLHASDDRRRRSIDCEKRVFDAPAHGLH